MSEGIFVAADHDGEWYTGHVIAFHEGKWAVRFFTHCSMPFIISETIARHLVDPIVHVFKPERIVYAFKPERNQRWEHVGTTEDDNER